jgi:hypothetical protein
MPPGGQFWAAVDRFHSGGTKSYRAPSRWRCSRAGGAAAVVHAADQGWQIKERRDHAVVDSGDCGAEPTIVIDFCGSEAEIVRRGDGQSNGQDP